MGFTNFPNGLTSLGIPVFGNIPQLMVGNVFWMVAAKQTTDPYYNLIKDRVPNEMIFTNLSDAYSNITDNQGDVLLINPGTYTSTASLTWAKDNCMIIGTGSPNQTYQPSTLGSTGGVKLKCVTAAVEEILKITGEYVSMYNIGTQNTADSAGNISDIRLVARNFYANHCSFRGGTGATQIATADCGVGMYIDVSVANAGNAMVMENCLFGSSGNTIRTVGAGCLVFGGGTAAGGFEPRFYNCEFSMYSSTAACYFISMLANAVFDRFCLFKNCTFMNFGSSATVLSEAIKNNNDTAWVLLQNCGGLGFATWSSTGVKHTYICNPAGSATGGIGISVA